MKKFVELLGKYNLIFSREVFYVLLNCIDRRIDTFQKLIEPHKNLPNFEEFQQDYKFFYDSMLSYFEQIEIDKDFMLHHKVIVLIDTILENRPKLFKNDLKIFISNVVDLIFMKYELDINNFETNEAIKEYLLEKIKDEKIVDLLVLLLLADTTLSFKEVEEIPEEEVENIIRTIILISIYICKGEK